jgi:transcription initiation factor TFIIIB Brf1 subunit/transcription initiation factor TFIIB
MEREKMTYGWRNLENNRCPNCDHKLAEIKKFQKVLVCDGCGFVITETKSKDITRKIKNEREDRQADKIANEFLRSHGIKSTTKL